MSVENFQVERVGKTVKIWFDSGADVDRSMLAFTHEFESEIEADLVRQKVIERIDENDSDMRSQGVAYARNLIISDEAVEISKRATLVYEKAAKLLMNEDPF